MIISASRRTDIPAFYPDWFRNRLLAGYCCVVNPCNAQQVTHVPLTPAEVEVFVFWTKNARPFLANLPLLRERDYRCYFQYTINGYPQVFEGGVPPLEDTLETVEALSTQLGADRVVWRYDPIIFSSCTSPSYHLERFARIAGRLRGQVSRVVISLLDHYRGTEGRLRRLQEEQGITITPFALERDDFTACLRELAAIARAQGMEITSCAEPFDLRPYGIQSGKCIDDAYIHRLFAIDVTHGKDKTQRPACGCVTSRDIGAYDTCRHDCAYCYATRSSTLAEKNYRRHQPDAPSLLDSSACSGIL